MTENQYDIWQTFVFSQFEQLFCFLSNKTRVSCNLVVKIKMRF